MTTRLAMLLVYRVGVGVPPFFQRRKMVKSRLQEMPIKARGLAASKRIGTYRTQALVFGTD